MASWDEVVQSRSEGLSVLLLLFLHSQKGIEDFLELYQRIVKREDVFLSLKHIDLFDIVHVELRNQGTQLFRSLEHESNRLLLFFELLFESLHLLDVHLVFFFLLRRRSCGDALQCPQVLDFLSLQHEYVVFLLQLLLEFLYSFFQSRYFGLEVGLSVRHTGLLFRRRLNALNGPEFLEEIQVFDVLGEGSEVWVWTQQNSNRTLRLEGNLLGKSDVSLQNIVFYYLLLESPVLDTRGGRKRRSSHHHFIHEYSHGPDIQLFIVSRSINHFGTQIVRSPAKRVSDLVFVVGVAPSEIAYFHLIFDQQNILGLEIPVQDRRCFVVQVGNRGGDLGHEESDLLFSQFVVVFDEVKKCPVRGQLHDHVDVLVVIEYSLESNDVGMAAGGQDFQLIQELREEFEGSQLVFGKDLHSIEVVALN